MIHDIVNHCLTYVQDLFYDYPIIILLYSYYT